MEANSNSFKIDIYCPSSFENYSLLFTYKNGQFAMRLSKGIDVRHWEEAFELRSLQAEYKFLGFFERDKELFDFLVNCLKENSVDLSEGSNNFMNLKFSVSLNNIKKEILFKLRNKVSEPVEVLGNVINRLPKIEENFEQMKKEIQNNKDGLKKKFEEYESEVNKKLDAMMSMILKLQEGNSLRQSCNNNTQTNVIVSSNFSFVPVNNNNGKFSFSNKNKILKRISDPSWFGVRCDPPKNISPKMTFSVRIDNVNQDKRIMIGWCMKNADNSNGYHSTPHSFCLYLYDGQFWNKGTYKEYAKRGMSAQKGDVFTATIYTYEKKIEFLLNGTSLCTPKAIEFNNEDIMFLCPFVDLCDTGIQVSIMD